MLTVTLFYNNKKNGDLVGNIYLEVLVQKKVMKDNSR